MSLGVKSPSLTVDSAGNRTVDLLSSAGTTEVVDLTGPPQCVVSSRCEKDFELAGENACAYV
jgi:hypothetical protein